MVAGWVAFGSEGVDEFGAVAPVAAVVPGATGMVLPTATPAEPVSAKASAGLVDGGSLYSVASIQSTSEPMWWLRAHVAARELIVSPLSCAT